MYSKSPDVQIAVRELGDCLIEHGISEEFTNLAEQHAKTMGVNQLPALKALMHDPPEGSKIYDVMVHGLGQWMAACQFAIFELTFYMGEKSLPFLREVAWGEYDWTQANAIETLIRLASKGIYREVIISEIKANFPSIRYEAMLYVVEPLLARIEDDENLRRIFKKLLAIPEFADVYHEIKPKNSQ